MRRMRIVHADPVIGAMSRRPVRMRAVLNAAAHPMKPARMRHDEGTMIRATIIVQNHLVVRLTRGSAAVPIALQIVHPVIVTATTTIVPHASPLTIADDLLHKAINAANEDVATNEYRRI